MSLIISTGIGSLKVGLLSKDDLIQVIVLQKNLQTDVCVTNNLWEFRVHIEMIFQYKKPHKTPTVRNEKVTKKMENKK